MWLAEKSPETFRPRSVALKNIKYSWTECLDIAQHDQCDWLLSCRDVSLRPILLHDSYTFSFFTKTASDSINYLLIYSRPWVSWVTVRPLTEPRHLPQPVHRSLTGPAMIEVKPQRPASGEVLFGIGICYFRYVKILHQTPPEVLGLFRGGSVGSEGDFVWCAILTNPVISTWPKVTSFLCSLSVRYIMVPCSID